MARSIDYTVPPEYEGRKASAEELQKIVQDLQERIYALEEASR